jgi:hypothetical protein
LDLISRDVEHSREISFTINKRLDEIHQSLQDTHQAVLSQSHSVKSILYSVSATSQRRQGSTISQPLLPWHTSGGFFEAPIEDKNSQREFGISMEPLEMEYRSSTAQIESGYSPPISPPLSRSSTFPYPMTQIDCELSSPTPSALSRSLTSAQPITRTELQRSHPASQPISPFANFPQPASPFEMSPKFFPEIYTTDSKLGNHRMSIHSSHEENSSASFRTNSYRLFFLKSPREISLLNLSITIHRTSIYWGIMRLRASALGQRDGFKGNIVIIPNSLLLKLEPLIAEASEELEDHSTISISLMDHRGQQTQDLKSHMYIVAPQDGFSPDHQKILSLLDDLGCPQYIEKEVIPVALLSGSNRFAAWVEGKLVNQRRFASAILPTCAIYMIQALYCLSQVSGVLKFIGIVVDASRKQLKGYMTEYTAGKFLGLNYRLSQEERIPWKRRENWARQIVEAISQVHGMGFVSGALWTSSWAISVTDSDRITLNSFRNKMQTVRSFPGGNIPPECRHSRSSKIELRKAINVTPKIDMFQLGMLLWLIGKQKPYITGMYFCKLAGCNAPIANSCNQKHSDPIGLPVLDDVPQYYKDIIALCRNEDPIDRPPAWRLLEMFPSDTDLEPLQAESPIEENPDIDIFKASYAEGTNCDRCSHHNGSASFFHCTTCHDGDWDMCLGCYNKGLHCLDPDHFLVEIKQMHVSAVPGSYDITAVPGSYHSRVNASGHREIIEL